LIVILGVFAIAVRITFARSLRNELINKLTILAQAATTDLEIHDEYLKVESDERLTNNRQALQWFDSQGNLVGQQGNNVVTLPFNPHVLTQIQTTPQAIQAVTITIRNNNTGGLIGYVRASESMHDLQGTLRRLDWGLEGGVMLALILSSIGGIWLTRQAMQPIEQSFWKLQQFTADASHELRSPLMVIKSNAAVALKYPEGIRESDAEKFRAIASAINQMSALTEDLLMLARTDQTSLQKQDSVSLTKILEQLVQLYKTQAEAQQLYLKAELLPELSVLGDADQLTRLFINLIDNALRYTPENGTVNIQTSRTGNTLIIHIQDTGVGIAPDQLAHIFDRFWRADRSRAYWSSGFGLGLAIAQGIAQKHGGMITVSSQLGVGSCFSVQLPTSTKP